MLYQASNDLGTSFCPTKFSIMQQFPDECKNLQDTFTIFQKVPFLVTNPTVYVL
jgi:hypothetical protein